MLKLVMVFLALLVVKPETSYAKWECKGPYYVCGSKNASVERSRTKTSNGTTKQRNVGINKKITRTASKRKTIKSDPIQSVGKAIGTIMASFYWQPQAIACGPGRFNPNAMTAAHKTLPCGTKLRVTSASTGKSVVVTINDRGPYIKGRSLDLSRAAFAAIDNPKKGVARVKIARL